MESDLKKSFKSIHISNENENIIGEGIQYSTILHKLNNSINDNENIQENEINKKQSRNDGRGLSDNIIQHIHLSSIAALKTDRSNNINAPASSETGVFGTKSENEEKDSKLNIVLKRINEYKSLRNSEQMSHDSERHLVGTLENELADIITLFQNENIAKSQEINKLNQEVMRLNKIIERQSASQPISDNNIDSVKTSRDSKSNSVHEAKIKGLEDLLHKMHKECFDSRNQIIKLQEIIKEKDRKIDELMQNNNFSYTDKNYQKLQAEILYLRGQIDAKNQENSLKFINEKKYQISGLGYESTEVKKKLENSLKTAQDETKKLLENLKDKNSEIEQLKRKLQEVTSGFTERRFNNIKNSTDSRNPGFTASDENITDKKYENEFENLIKKVKNLELHMRNGQKEYSNRTQEYLQSVKELEKEIKNQCNLSKDTSRASMQDKEKLWNEVKGVKNMLLDMEQKYSFQVSCSKSLQEGIFIENLLKK